MAKLIIEDLTEDAQLDAEAMRAVTGGLPLTRQHTLKLERRYRAGVRFDESTIVPGLIRTGDLRGR
jgi:hypothetical protein